MCKVCLKENSGFSGMLGFSLTLRKNSTLNKINDYKNNCYQNLKGQHGHVQQIVQPKKKTMHIDSHSGNISYSCKSWMVSLDTWLWQVKLSRLSPKIAVKHKHYNINNNNDDG